MADEIHTLRDPKTPLQRLVRKLAEAAMAITHHDIGDDCPEYVFEIRHMEAAFGPKIRAFMASRTRKSRANDD